MTDTATPPVETRLTVDILHNAHRQAVEARDALQRALVSDVLHGTADPDQLHELAHACDSAGAAVNNIKTALCDLGEQWVQS